MEFLFAQISNLKKNYFLLLIFIVILLINDFFIVIYFNHLKINEVELKNNPVVSYVKENNKEDENNLFVDIKGYVKKTGVYKVNKNMTVSDAINLAGGLKKGATTENINLSKRLEDQMVIIVSSKKSYDKSLKNNDKTIKNDAIINKDEKALIINNLDSLNVGKTNEANSLVNINYASLDELMTISGIGQSKAEAIISYRQNQKYNTIEDIKNVSGIGDSLYEKIKNHITV